MSKDSYHPANRLCKYCNNFKCTCMQYYDDQDGDDDDTFRGSDPLDDYNTNDLFKD